MNWFHCLLSTEVVRLMYRRLLEPKRQFVAIRAVAVIKAMSISPSRFSDRSEKLLEAISLAAALEIANARTIAL